MKQQIWWVGLLLTGVLLAACGDNEAKEPADAALNLPLQTLAGDQVNLSDYTGQVILVNFWATWCGPCRAEMPILDAYYQAHRDDGLALLAVNAGESAGRAQEYIDEGGYGFPVMLDPDGFVADYFGGVRGMPTTFVLDRRGEVVYQHVGPLEETILDAEVTSLLQ